MNAFPNLQGLSYLTHSLGAFISKCKGRKREKHKRHKFFPILFCLLHFFLSFEKVHLCWTTLNISFRSFLGLNQTSEWSLPSNATTHPPHLFASAELQDNAIKGIYWLLSFQDYHCRWSSLLPVLSLSLIISTNIISSKVSLRLFLTMFMVKIS